MRRGARAQQLEALAAEAMGCTRCELHECGTQTVFGDGPANADVVLVGEQPGDKEDLAGEPFVGPAGRVLDDALEAGDAAAVVPVYADPAGHPFCVGYPGE